MVIMLYLPLVFVKVLTGVFFMSRFLVGYNALTNGFVKITALLKKVSAVHFLAA